MNCQRYSRLLKITIVLTALFAFLLVSISQTVEASNTPKYVFYFIGDGMGVSQRQAAEYFKQAKEDNPTSKLLMNTFPVAGLMTTHSANETLITDSAAAGTALATGHKTLNGMLAKLPDGKAVKTLVEAAAEKGLATGIVTTTRLTHATPAAFVSHNTSRHNEHEIAMDLANSGVDFLAGGGYGYFVPKNYRLESNRNDDRNLLEIFHRKKYNVFITEKETGNFRKFHPKGLQKVMACFTPSHLPYEFDRINDKRLIPSLAEITEKGIEVLSQYPQGFFMMVEGGRIDQAGHLNDALRSCEEVLAFDQAIAKAYEFYKKHPKETLILVLADHESGGMTLGYGTKDFLKMKNLLDNHVPKHKLKRYSHDRAAYFDYLTKETGLGNLLDDERAIIERAMDVVENNGDQEKIYVAIKNVLSNRAGIAWTTQNHTGACVPISAIGVGAEKFGGFKDNTEIAKTMAALLNLELT
ncbi:alkaline phosphatase [Desulforamulus aeronauticus]|uniref:Alkaline phosphatase n=1 Tax=Desulforamulus aeronauticus DSM 10349 TaxID=1121421 RepID=A0A1M6TEK4_9FIRM|nr:alkaline phosphatase [Desulforamulus aeronauticus]SHK55304.1 alkaline phosphatase [Desulforamulus aeronauticus DSM 10349]